MGNLCEPIRPHPSSRARKEVSPKLGASLARRDLQKETRHVGGRTGMGTGSRSAEPSVVGAAVGPGSAFFAGLGSFVALGLFLRLLGHP